MTGENNLELFISRDKIAEAVRHLAQQVERDHTQETPLLVAVLKGSFMFLADLVRELKGPVELDFLRLSSYGSSTSTSGKIKLLQGVSIPVRGRSALVVEDIVDTGLTTSYAARYLRRKGASSVKICALLDKPSRRLAPVTLDYVGFTVPNRFVVGYGLDFDEKYRYLPDIYVLRGGSDGP